MKIDIRRYKVKYHKMEIIFVVDI